MTEKRQEIDWYDLDQNCLMVRGREVTDLARQDDYAATVIFALTGKTPSLAEVEAALLAGWREADGALDADLPFSLSWPMADDPATAIETLACCLFTLRRENKAQTPEQSPLPEILDDGAWQAFRLFCQIFLIAGAMIGRGSEAVATLRAEGGFDRTRFAVQLSRLFAAHPSTDDPADPRARLLSTLIGGFGVAAPTTTLARFSASTRAPLEWTLAASTMGCGPGHLGACSLAMRRLTEALASPKDAAGVYCRTKPFPGFGHPIMPLDTRTGFLFKAFGGELPQKAAALAREVTKRSGLNPNIDLATAAVFLSWGVPWSVGSTLFWLARLPIVLAQACAKRAEPAFGLNSAEAREKYRELPRLWV